MFERGIIDPAKVVRIALQDAASVAGLMITAAPRRLGRHGKEKKYGSSGR
jgi:hypothetical protein